MLGSANKPDLEALRAVFAGRGSWPMSARSHSGAHSDTPPRPKVSPAGPRTGRPARTGTTPRT